MVKAACETWPNPRVKVNSTLAWSLQQEPLRLMKTSIVKIRSLWICIKTTVERKFILFDYKYCAIILLKWEIMI